MTKKITFYKDDSIFLSCILEENTFNFIKNLNSIEYSISPIENNKHNIQYFLNSKQYNIIATDLFAECILNNYRFVENNE